jgi:hypothetical protein
MLRIFILLPFSVIVTSTPSVTCVIFLVAAPRPAPQAVNEVASTIAEINVMVRRIGAILSCVFNGYYIYGEQQMALILHKALI